LEVPKSAEMDRHVPFEVNLHHVKPQLRASTNLWKRLYSLISVCVERLRLIQCHHIPCTLHNIKMRLDYVPPTGPPTASGSDKAFIQRLLKSRGSAGLSKLDGALLHSPPLARGFLQFFTAVRGKAKLPADLLELAMCRVAALNGAAYEWVHHAPLLVKAGVSEEGLETVRKAKAGERGGEGHGGLTERLWKALRYTDAMTKQVHVPDAIFQDLKTVLDDREIVELSRFAPWPKSTYGDQTRWYGLTALTICGYNAVSRFLVAMDVAELKDVEVGKATEADHDAGAVPKAKLW
jgi:alkylhydroperoxidase family enzyme